MEPYDEYRRGTVLGLTIAEIFILLVFLLLLALAGVNYYWKEKNESLKHIFLFIEEHSLEHIESDEWRKWASVIDSHTPEDVTTALHYNESIRIEIMELIAEKERLQQRIRLLTEDQGSGSEELARTKEALANAEAQLEEQQKALDRLQAELNEKNEALKRISIFIQEHSLEHIERDEWAKWASVIASHTPEDVAKALQDSESIRNEITELNAENERLQELIRSLAEDQGSHSEELAMTKEALANAEAQLEEQQKALELLQAELNEAQQKVEELATTKDALAYAEAQLEEHQRALEQLQADLNEVPLKVGELAKTKDALAKAEAQLEEHQKALERLRAELIEAQQKVEELAKTKDALAKAETQLEEHQTALERLQAELIKAQQKLEELARTKEALASAESQLEEYQRALERLQAELNEAQVKVADLTRALEKALLDLDALKQDSSEQSDLQSLRDRLRMAGKGVNPPCWYRRVAETNRITLENWREKPLHLFDIAIRDDSMEIQPVVIPTGRAEDDDGLPYFEEVLNLSLDDIPYGTQLSNNALRRSVNHIVQRAQASKVRTYACVFSVRVWDETSDEAKSRWKQAHDYVLEQLFNTYQVQDVAWSDRESLPNG